MFVHLRVWHPIHQCHKRFVVKTLTDCHVALALGSVLIKQHNERPTSCNTIHSCCGPVFVAQRSWAFEGITPQQQSSFVWQSWAGVTFAFPSEPLSLPGVSCDTCDAPHLNFLCWVWAVLGEMNPTLQRGFSSYLLKSHRDVTRCQPSPLCNVIHDMRMRPRWSCHSEPPAGGRTCTWATDWVKPLFVCFFGVECVKADHNKPSVTEEELSCCKHTSHSEPDRQQ